MMHLGTFNLADLIVSLWRSQFDNERTDPISAWPWAVLQGDTWEQHGKAVAETTPYLPGSLTDPLVTLLTRSILVTKCGNGYSTCMA